MEFWQELLKQGFSGEYDFKKGIFHYPERKELREIVTVAAYKSLTDKAYLRVE